MPWPLELQLCGLVIRVCAFKPPNVRIRGATCFFFDKTTRTDVAFLGSSVPCAFTYACRCTHAKCIQATLAPCGLHGKEKGQKNHEFSRARREGKPYTRLLQPLLVMLTASPPPIDFWSYDYLGKGVLYIRGSCALSLA